MSVPESAVSWRDGKSYVFTLNENAAPERRVSQQQVQLGRRAKKRVEVLNGLSPEAQVVEAGAAFLSDGDVVRVVAHE